MDDLSLKLAEQLPAAQHDVDVFLALQALSRAAPEVALPAIAGFIRSASARQVHLARSALILLAERAPALLVDATLDDHAAVADAAKQALLACPTNEALPFLLRLGKSKSADEVTTALMLLGRISSPEVRAPLFKALSHRTLSARSYAAGSIRTRADESWLPELLEAIRALRREEFEKKKDFSEIIDSLCGTVVDKASAASLPLLLEGLQDHDSVMRKACIIALGRVGDESAVLPLIALLDNPQRGLRYRSGDPSSQDLRQEAAGALGRLGDARAIAPLLQAGAAFSAQALGELKALEAVPELIAALAATKVPRDASDIAAVLARLTGPGEQDWPRVALQSESLTVRRAAALQLLHVAPDEAVPHLLSILSQLQPGDSIDVAGALAAQGLKEGLLGLAAALQDDPHHWNASAVAFACESLQGAEVQALLLQLLPGIRNEYVQRVCNALAAQGAAVLPALIDAARSAKSDVHHRYVVAISGFRQPECAELLAELMLPNNPLRDAASLALAGAPSVKASAALAAALRRGGTPAEERQVAEILATAATREAIPDLLQALAKGYAAEEILDALGRIADASAVPALLDQLTSTHAERRRAAAAALEQIDDPQAAPALLALLSSEKSLEVVPTALAALLQVSDADDAWVSEGLSTPGTRAFWLASVRHLEDRQRNVQPST